MAETTWEEASRCPQCGQPGESIKKIPMPPGSGIPRGTVVHTVKCQNTKRCDFGVWLVQVNPDGSVPPKTDHTGHEKKYVGFEDHDQQARDMQRLIRSGLARERNLSQQEGGYEVRKKGGDL
jgi:hypothetical protein